MDRTIEGYLAHLRAALADADPALVQDALFDAEEYLRDAIAENPGDPAAAFDAAVEAYGTPDEIAASYREAELTVKAALRSPKPSVINSDNPIARFFGVLADPQAWGSLFYMLLALATGVVYFTLVITGMSLSIGTAILIIGLPIALLTLAVVRSVSLAEGRIVEGLLGVRMPRRPRVVAAEGGLVQRIKWWLTDYRTWTTMLYMLLQLPLGIVYFTIVVTGFSAAAGLIAGPVVATMMHAPIAINGTTRYFVEPIGIPVFMLLGALVFVVTMWVAKGIGTLHGRYAKTLLVGASEPAATTLPMGAPSNQPASGNGGPLV